MDDLTLGGRPLRLVQPPRSRALVLAGDVAVHMRHHSTQATAAALGACLPPEHSVQARYSDTQSVLEYGAAVVEELTARGMTLSEFSRAGRRAFDLVVSLWPTARQVEEATGFSEAGADQSCPG